MVAALVASVLGTLTATATSLTPPVISNVQSGTQIVGAGSWSATVTWTTDVPSTSQLLYGEGSSPINPALVTAHSVTVTGLSPGTSYFAQVRSTDAAANTSTSPGFLITTGPAGVAVVSNVQVINVTETSATVTWTTDVPADGQVFVNGSSQGLVPGLVTSHSVPVSGLVAGTTYTVMVRSAGANGVGGYSSPASFTTAGTVDTTAPTIVSRNPAPAATGVDADVVVSATFSELTRDSFDFIVRDDRGMSIPGIVSKTSASLTATFDPAAPLNAGRSYSVLISHLRDLNGNQMADATWAFTVAGTPDTTAPTVAARSPARDATGVAVDAVVSVTFSEPVQGQRIELADDRGRAVAAVASMPSGSLTATLKPSAPLQSGILYGVKVFGARDASGNLMADDSWSFMTACPCPGISVLDWYTGPPPSANAGGPIELGAKFRSSMDGYVTGVRFLKGSSGAGSYVGHLWSSSGQLLASATFVGDGSAGWQTATFGGPVRISANTTYVASYFSPNGDYPYSHPSVNLSQAARRGPLTILADGTDGGNGVYRMGPSGFPNQSYNSANYWADVVFTTTPPPDTSAPTIVSRGPAASATDAGVRGAITATFSEAVQPGTIAFALRDGAGAAVAGSMSYDAATGVASFTPSGALALGTTYTATVSGATDAAGNAMAPEKWSFRVATCPCSLWSDDVTPAVTTLQGGGPIELGVRFRSEVDGYVTGVRFYKGAHNTGTHVGRLWGPGFISPLASATFTDESATGWQEVTFATPVRISAWTTYTASYSAPNGGYAYDSGYFGNPPHTVRSVSRGPLTAGYDSTGGVYRYGVGSLPDQTYNGTNYWVDVVFTPAP